MLEYKLTPHHAGIALWGDSATLHRLHTFVHHVVEECDYIEDKEGFVLGLAYDLRKAIQGQRSQDYRRSAEDDQCRIYGVEILWPVILVQISLLRQAMAFIPTNKLDQAIMFELEHVVETALRAATPVLADEVIYRMRCIGNASYMHLDTILDSRCRYFIGLPAKQRLKMLPKLMDTFDPMYETFADVPTNRRSSIISVDAFVYGEEDWPDFEW